ncbi:MAG: SDR family oxidoreductase [Verrucomicrobiota bacterium]
MKILVTGATGYIGGRLIPELLQRGHALRVLVRDRRRIYGREWEDQVEVYEGDLSDPATLKGIGEGIEAAYYLVHSMTRHENFAEIDLEAATHFAEATATPDLKQVVYLGGLIPKEGAPSPHLASRAEVGERLRSHLPTTEFRAGPIIGSGSASFEMVRYLTDRLPAMVAPKWIQNEVQPLGIRDVLAYLVQALDKPPLGVVEIGANLLTFREMMLQYASVRGYTRLIFPVPVLTPKLSALWVGLVTPITNRLAGPLIEGILHPLTADTTKAKEHFPEVDVADYRTSVQRALDRIKEGLVLTRWSGIQEDIVDEQVDWQGMIRERIVRTTSLRSSELFQTVQSLGGDKGWLVWEWAWALRGWMDKLVGGPGLRRGRRHPQELYQGESLDFWRVEAVEANQFLRLRAEMKVPGRAWLQFEILPGSENGDDAECQLIQTAFFEPEGVFGFLYWYLLYPLHHLIFNDMADAILSDAFKRVSLQEASARSPARQSSGSGPAHS